MLGIEVDTSVPAERVVCVLEQVMTWRGMPKAIHQNAYVDRYSDVDPDLRVAFCADTVQMFLKYQA